MKNALVLVFFCILGSQLSCVEQDPNSRNIIHTLSAREMDENTLIDSDDDCPVGLVSGIPLDEEFGPGTAEITRCLDNREGVRVVYQVNKSCGNADCSKPYALGNIRNAILDYEITHGLPLHDGYDITLVVYSAGYQLVLDNNAIEPFGEPNPFQDQVEELLLNGVHVYFCQNTGRNKGIITANLIPGVEWVTSGVTAITDFELKGYASIAP